MTGLFVSAGGVWWAWMVSMTLQVAILGGAIWVLSAACSRGSASLRYFLWLIIFVKLVLPPGLSAPWSVARLVPVLPVSIAPVRELQWEPARPPTEAPPKRSAEDSPRMPTPAKPFPITPAAAAMGLWGLVATVLLAGLFVQWRTYTRKILRTLREAPEAVRVVFEEQRMAVGGPSASVHISSAIGTPGVFGVIHPRVLLPSDWEERFCRKELAAILAHECAHIRRGDLWQSWIITLLSCVYWFHPVVWLANLYLRREREMVCDDMALTVARQEGKDYASAILRVVEQFDGRVPAGAGLLGLLEMSDNLLHRVRSIGDRNRPRKMGIGSCVVLVLIILCLPMGIWRVDARSMADARMGEGAGFGKTGPTDAVVAQAPPSLALMDFSRLGSAETLGDAAAKVRELLTQSLANTAGVRLVDREKIDKALSEVHLDATGLVDGVAAAKVGKLVGAQILAFGKLMELDGEFVTTIRLINTETSEIQALRVTGKESEGLVKLADAAAGAIAAKLATAAPTPGATTETSALDAAIERLRGDLAGKTLPRIAVCVPESHLGTIVPDPAGETEIVKVLTRVGYPVVDIATFMKRENGSTWLNVFWGRSREREGHELALTQGGRGAAEILHDKRIDKLKAHADIFVIGEAFSEFAGDNYGFKSCNARVEVKALDTAKETVAAATSEHAAAADTAEMVAGKKALREAGGQVGLDLARKLADYWGKRQ